MNVNDYLQTIRKQLTVKSDQANKIITEIQAHLQDQFRLHTLNGMNEAEATQAAITEFGSASAVALRFNTAYQHPLHSFWRVVGLTVVVYAIIRILVITVFYFSDYGRKFSLTVGPGFYDHEFFIYGCLGFIVMGIMMASCIYRYLVPIHPSQTTLKLALFYSTAAVSTIHLALSTTKFFLGIAFNNQIALGVDNYGEPVFVFNIIPVDRLVYYLGINAFYIALTTMVLALTMHIVFHFLQKNESRNTVVA